VSRATQSTGEQSRRPWPAHLGGTDGFTLVEVLVSMMMVVIVFSALAVLFATANDSSLASQRQESRLLIVQQQIEKVRTVVLQYGFAALALSTNPSAPSDSPLPANPTDPNDFITGSGTTSEAFLVESNYNGTSAGVIAGTPATGEPLMAPVTGVSGGQISPVQCTDVSTGTTYPDPLTGGTYPACSGVVPSGDPYAMVSTYVTQASTAGCNTLLTGSCAGDVRRVIVAVVFHNTAYGGTRKNLGPNTPTYSTTVFSNPVASNQTAQASGLRILGLIP
jgi:type II secretory pathway pseudopilin PulG